jgi:cholestenol Delta-isomerase
MTRTPDHPFYPLDTHLIEYVPNTLSVEALLGFFTLATLAVITFTSAVLKWFKPSISRQDKFLVGWFVFSK